MSSSYAPPTSACAVLLLKRWREACDFSSLLLPRADVIVVRKQARKKYIYIYIKMVRTKADSVPSSYRKGKIPVLMIVLIIISVVLMQLEQVQ